MCRGAYIAHWWDPFTLSDAFLSLGWQSGGIEFDNSCHPPRGGVEGGDSATPSLYVGEVEGQLGKNAATPRGHNRLKTPAAGSGNFFVAYGADKHLPRSPNPTSCNMFSFSQDPVDQYFDATLALYWWHSGHYLGECDVSQARSRLIGDVLSPAMISTYCAIRFTYDLVATVCCPIARPSVNLP